MFLSGAFGWGVGKVFDAITKCFVCGQQDERRIGNVQNNYLYCSNCHKENRQFTNACDFTIDKMSLEIGQGIVRPAGKKWIWENKGGWFEEKTKWLMIPHFVRLVGLQGRDVVLKTEIRSYDTNKLICTYSSLLTPSSHNSKWDGFNHLFQDGNFRNIKDKLLSVDGILMSEYKDVICEDRRLIEPWK